MPKARGWENANNMHAEACSLYELQMLGIVKAAGRVRLSNKKPSEWTEEKVKMGDPRPGPYRYSYTPYCREIIDRLYGLDPAKWIAVMKGLQIGISAGVLIPGMGWIIQESPGNTYFTVGSNDLIDKSVDKLDLMIDRAGIRPYIKPQTQRNKNQKSGDTNQKKDFANGFINITTPNNHKEWRDVSLKYGLIDDFEAAKSKSKESGNTRMLMEGRFAAYKDTHKIFYISTPELKINSNIEPAYLLGDQRKFMVPCPCCGVFIELRWNVPDGIGTIWDAPMPDGTGIIWDYNEDGTINDDKVGYVCQECNKFFDDSHKMQMLQDGYWQPTAKPSQPGYFSYHISSLYAPVGMYDWKHYVHNYVQAHPKGQPRKEDEYKTFLNTCLGITYEATGEAPKATAIMKNMQGYEIGTVPEKLSIAQGNGRIVLLTCGADLNGKLEDGRLDYEVLAHTESGATYSIDHGSIGTFQRGRTGDKDIDREHYTYEHNMPNSVWPEFERILQREYEVDTMDAEGRKMTVWLTCLDVGAFAQAAAYPFLDRTNCNVIGVKGDKEDRYQLIGKDRKVFKKGLERPDIWILEVGLIKDRLSEYMNLKWDGNEGQPPHFMNYPLSSGGKYLYDNYFLHYEAEERRAVADKDGILKYRWTKKNSAVQNHMLDCRVYNYAAREIMLFQFAQEWKVKDLTWQEWVDLALSHL